MAEVYHGSALASISAPSRLVKKGGAPAAAPEGVYIGDTVAPLLEGELGRAAEWSRRIVAGL